MGPFVFPLFICLALAFSQASSSPTQCKENYKMFQDSCYFLSPDKNTWGDAKQKCASHGGSLVSIQSEEENTFVRGLFQDSKNPVWIGGYKYPHTEDSSMKWRWIDGQPMDYLNWDVKQPRDFKSKVSMMMFTSGKWANEVPTQEFPFVCEQDSKPTCDEGYSLYNSHCFSYQEEKLGFNEAQKKCSDEGGNLASVHSGFENFLLRVLSGHNYVWLGGKMDPGKDGLWMWTDGTQFDYKKWAKYQPAESPNNNCMLMNYPGCDYQSSWTNEVCDTAYGYICKKPKRQPV